jgi:protein-tyrosine phosphatase
MSGVWEVENSGFRILAVCTGNVCRSPLAERMLQSGFDDIAQGHFFVTSAGTHGLVGSPVTAEITEIADRLGVGVESFRARRLTAAMIQEADLVLTMDRSHRGTVVELVPQALMRTFTLPEMARILPFVAPERGARPDQRWRSAVALAQRQRRPSTGDPAADDIVDPYRKSAAVYRQMVNQLVPAVDTLIEWERRNGRAGGPFR